MIAPVCECSKAKKHGKDRKGNQRFRCRECGRTWTEEPVKPIGDMRIDLQKACLAIQMLLEGMSVRSVERMTGLHRDTICTLVATVGQNCGVFLKEFIRDVPANDVQCDEIWGFVGCKEKTRKRLEQPETGRGDAWCYTAIERDSKLILTWWLGKRDSLDTWEFIDNLREATTGRFQVTTDGLSSYHAAIPNVFMFDVDYAMLVKKFYQKNETYTHKRYSPSAIVGIDVAKVCGRPDDDRICTSHVERHNLTIRMQLRRMTRLTNGFSKKWENHEAMLGLFFAYYNFCRKHMTLKTSPAVKHGLTDHVWSIEELLTRAAESATQS